MKACEEMNGKDGLYVTKAVKKEQRMKEIEMATHKFKMSMTKVNIYLKNIPNKATEEQLVEFLSKFGKIQSYKFFRSVQDGLAPIAPEVIENDENGVSGFGYVSYQNAEQAYKAIKEGPELDFMGHKMYFNKWEPKEVRTAHNEEKHDQKILQRYMRRINNNFNVKESLEMLLQKCREK